MTNDRSPNTMATCPCCNRPTVSTEVGTGRCWECAMSAFREYRRRDALLTRALGVAPGETLRIELDAA